MNIDNVSSAVRAETERGLDEILSTTDHTRSCCKNDNH